MFVLHLLNLWKLDPWPACIACLIDGFGSNGTSPLMFWDDKEWYSTYIPLGDPLVSSILCSVAVWCQSTPVAGMSSFLSGTLSFLSSRWPAATIHGRQATGALPIIVLVRCSREFLETPCKQSLSRANWKVLRGGNWGMHVQLLQTELRQCSLYLDTLLVS